MKFLLVLGWCLMAATAAIPAEAAPFGHGAYFRPYMQNRPFMQNVPSRSDPRRDAFRPDPRREASRPDPQRETRPPAEADRGRMSPDERRQLRRDIQDAGRDIYHRDRQAPRRFGRR